MRDCQGYRLENVPHPSWAFPVLGIDFKPGGLVGFQALNPSAHRLVFSLRPGVVLLVFYAHSG